MSRRALLTALLIVAGASIVGWWWISDEAELVGDDPATVVRPTQDGEPPRQELPDPVAAAPVTLEAEMPGDTSGPAATPEQTAQLDAALQALPKETFRGAVVDSAGRPVADATVVFIPSHATWHAAGRDVWWAHQVNAAVLPRTLTDARGKFEVRGPNVPSCAHDPDPGRFWAAVPALLVIKDGNTMHPHGCAGYRSGTYDAGTLAVEPPARVRGRVVDPDGRPLADIRVIASTSKVTPAILPPDAVRVHTWDDVMEIFSRTRTGADGRFEIGGLWQGRCTMYYRGTTVAAHWVQDVPLVSGEVVEFGDVTLQPGATISGRVVDEHGKPLAGVEVLANIDDAKPKRDNPEDDLVRTIEAFDDAFTRRTRSDAQGRFVIDRLYLDEIYGVFARTEGREPGVASRVRPGTGDVELQLASSPRVGVTVLDAVTDEPLRDAKVLALRHLSPNSLAGVLTTVERTGRSAPTHTVHGVGRFITWLYVSADGYASNSHALETVGKDVPTAVTVRLRRQGTIEGRVLDTHGRGIREASVRVHQTAMPDQIDVTEHWPAAVTDDVGRFELGSLGPGNWTLRASAEGFVETERVMVTLQDSATSPNIVLQRSARISGRLLELDGRPVAGEEVNLRKATRAEAAQGSFVAKRGSPFRTTFGDPSGAYAFDDLPAGDYVVEWKLKRDVTLAEGDQVVVDLMFVGPPTLWGYVYDRGAMAAGGNMLLMRRDPSTGRFPSGRRITSPIRSWGYRVELDQPGTYSITAQVGDPPRFSERRIVEVRDGDELPVHFEIGTSVVTGRVLDAATDRPVGKANVGLRGAEDSINSYPLGTVATDAEGRFEISGVGPGAYQLIAYESDYLSRAVDRFDVPADGPVDLGDLRLPRTPTLVVDARAPDGRPRRMDLSILLLDEAKSRVVRSQQRPGTGLVRMRQVEPGRYWAIALGGSRAASSSWRQLAHELVEVVLVSGEETTVELTIH